MKIEHRNLTKDDILSIRKLDEIPLMLDNLTDEERDIDLLLEYANDQDYKYMNITSFPFGSLEGVDIIVIHGFPGDNAEYIYIGPEYNEMQEKDFSKECRGLMHEFDAWYNKQTDEGATFDLDLFYSHSEGTFCT